MPKSTQKRCENCCFKDSCYEPRTSWALIYALCAQDRASPRSARVSVIALPVHIFQHIILLAYPNSGPRVDRCMHCEVQATAWEALCSECSLAIARCNTPGCEYFQARGKQHCCVRCASGDAHSSPHARHGRHCKAHVADSFGFGPGSTVNLHHCAVNHYSLCGSSPLGPRLKMVIQMMIIQVTSPNNATVTIQCWWVLLSPKLSGNYLSTCGCQ